MEVKKWNYEAKHSFDTGYLDLEEALSKYSKEQFDSLDEEGKKALIEEVFQIYRERNVYPITYYTHEDILDEIRYCKEKELPKFDGSKLDKRPTLGNGLLKFLFPNYWTVNCKEDKNNSLYERFYDDHKLKRAIDFCFKFKPKIKYPLVPCQIKEGLQMIGGNMPTNFLPMKVRMLLEHFMPNGGNYFDFSCGFGGRLLGAMTANCGPINYYGLEPNTETHIHLGELKSYIQEALGISEDRMSIFRQGSECDLPASIIGNIDFAFSSPPYFNLEKYSEEETQCYIKYPTIESWLENYVELTIKNIYLALKPGAYYAVNISDFKTSGEDVKFVDDWIEISNKCGFELVKEIPTKIGRSRPNNLSNQKIYVPKVESIYLFKKVN